MRTAFNPADCGTRPTQVKEDSVGPLSDWENGQEWMRNMSIDEAIPYVGGYVVAIGRRLEVIQMIAEFLQAKVKPKPFRKWGNLEE